MTDAALTPLTPDLFRLDGRLAIVTGGGRGIGLAIAKALAGQGATVVIGGRNKSTLETALAELQTINPACRSHELDVANEVSVAAFDEWIEHELGAVGILVNNAGINPFYKAPEDTSLAEWQQIVDVNLTGVFLCCRAFGKRMVERSDGCIINITSVAGHVGLRKTAAYCAAKAGVELLTKSLALDWADKNVRVNCVAPGYFETDLTAGLRDHQVLANRVIQKTPLGRFGTVPEIGGAVAFLASSAASYVTGQTIMVDGGWTAA
jgi:NAD(P)-dependent dehydrogenase (short-subunit alcohol dehydrogenase family)